jgi:molybdate transport system substrate-binding protein
MRRLLLIALLLSMFLASSAFAAEVHFSVAASMTDAAKELVATYEKKVENVTLLANFASSGALAKQILQGAPADIYVSANPKWMNHLVEKKLVPAEEVRTFAYNTLVFVGKPNPAVSTLEDITKLQRIAIGSPKSVPAGQYAEQALKTAGLYEKVQGKLILAKDVRQALIYADRGETDGAFVYKTDALLADDAVILLEVPQSLYDEVTYPVSLTLAGLEKPEAIAFFDFLKTDEATSILKKYGFVVR